MKSKIQPVVTFALFLASSTLAQTGEVAEVPTYETGFTVTSRIGNELYNALPAKHQSQVHIQPVALETDMRPFVKTEEFEDDPKPLKLVFISIGFIDLMNNISHAKAIDKIQPGYFRNYITSLAGESGETSLKPLPSVFRQEYWSEKVINDQKSNFNQMVGMVVAIELSHHYLGHFKRYGDRIQTDDLPVPMNNLLNHTEWDASVKAGVQNALDCGYGVEGVKALYETIEKMPQRPGWTAYFLPKNVEVSRLMKDLERAEKSYFGQ